MTTLVKPLTKTRSRRRSSRRIVVEQQPVTRTSRPRPSGAQPAARAYQQDVRQMTRRTAPVAPITRAMSVSNLETPVGSAFFDRCTDEIMSLHYWNTLDLLDWMSFTVSDEYKRVLEFIAYVRPARDGGNPTAGHLADPCEDPKGLEYGKATLEYEGFGRYGRLGPDRDFMKPKRYCRTDPVRRLDGEVVDNEAEWDLRFVVDQILGDIRTDLVVGNPSVDGQFGGLEHWVSTNYTGQNADVLKSTVIDWNGNPMSGGAGVTWNGNPIANGYNLVDVLLSAWRRKKQRIMWTRQFRNQRIMLGDAIILTTTANAECLLDHYTCWSVCEGGQYSPVNLQQMEARKFRNNLVSAENPLNLFGFGYITLDNTAFPILAYDHGLIKGPTLSDLYLLVGQIGGVRIWEGELQGAQAALDDMPEVVSVGGYNTVDGGRILTLTETENECFHMKGWMHPRLFCRAPWAQIRFMNVKCSTPGGQISGDPDESSFFINSSFTPATSS